MKMHMQIEKIRFGLEITVRLKRMMVRTLSTQSGSDVNFDDRYLNTPGCQRLVLPKAQTSYKKCDVNNHIAAEHYLLTIHEIDCMGHLRHVLRILQTTINDSL